MRKDLSGGMKKDLPGVKVALLAANGFCQDDMIAAQKALLAAGANVRMVSPENGLVNSWDGEGWGHHFAVEAPLASALGSDFAILVIPGGQRSIDKLGLTAHTRRFVGSFLDSDKPVVAMDVALQLVLNSGKVAGRTVSGPEGLSELAAQAGANWKGGQTGLDGALLTGIVTADNRAAFIETMMENLVAGQAQQMAA